MKASDRLIVVPTKKHAHLFSISGLDFSHDLFTSRCEGEWFRLGKHTPKYETKAGVKSAISRQSILMRPTDFQRIFSDLDSCYRTTMDLGKPSYDFIESKRENRYEYRPFYLFKLPFIDYFAEPVAFIRSLNSQSAFFLNPDIVLLLELEELKAGSGSWWDRSHALEVIRKFGSIETNEIGIEIRVKYLLHYLKVRQLSLLVCQFKHLILESVTQDQLAKIKSGTIVLGSPDTGTKAIIETNLSDKRQLRSAERRLDLWFEIKASSIDLNNPFSMDPSFDLYDFTLPTRSGNVAPGRFKHSSRQQLKKFKGVEGTDTESIYFKQEVLSKYQNSSDFDVDDHGNVFCGNRWSLSRSTFLIGNELLSTWIGDFAQGVPEEEWAHWKSFSVEPPSAESLNTFCEEETLPNMINSFVESMKQMNDSVVDFSFTVGAKDVALIWKVDDQDPALRQLKSVYPSNASEHEFLRRITLLSRIFTEEVNIADLRLLLGKFGKDLHKGLDGKTLASRSILQRAVFIASILRNMDAQNNEIVELIRCIDSNKPYADGDLLNEAKSIWHQVRNWFAPIAYLYDMRNSGGVAHKFNAAKVEESALNLDLHHVNWTRQDFLKVLSDLIDHNKQITENFEAAAARYFELRGKH